MVKCQGCTREVDVDNLDRYGECSWCRAEERSMNMSVGDLKDK